MSGNIDEHQQPPSSPITPPLPQDPNYPLLAQGSPRANFMSSPLSPHYRNSSRPPSRAGSVHLNRIASEDSQVLGGAGGGMASVFSTMNKNRGSMLLYRLASDDDGPLLPPSKNGYARDSAYSVASSGGESIFSLSADSKYPVGGNGNPRGMVAYAYEPDLDDHSPEADDFLHDPRQKDKPIEGHSLRGFLNLGLLILIIVALLALFVFYPVFDFYRRNHARQLMTGNTAINGTGQAPAFLGMASLIDNDTPQDRRSRKGFDGQDYELVFSDEFNKDGRTFYPGDDPYWEAADLWYWATNDLEWYLPTQAYTQGGQLHLRLEEIETNGLQFRSGMLQSWNKFCFSSGYIEVGVSLPGQSGDISGYWPGAWTMGNLGRPGYGASTDGLWPYSYDTCDIGTLKNQTTPDGLGPPAALHSDFSRDKYNNELSWLPGQRTSACTCPGEDHPGPANSVGRGVPELDILEVQKSKTTAGGRVSQSAQFAPFNADYVYLNQTDAEFKIFNPTITVPNDYKGSAIQQAVSGLTAVDNKFYAGAPNAPQFVSMGFEYWANPQNREEGFVTWQVDDTPTVQFGATAVGADSAAQIGQRLIPEEPMAIILNLAVSTSFQPVDFQAMTFPAELLVDYVRVYQRVGHTNVGCSPPDYPTADYINRHMEAYTNPQLMTWASMNLTFPKNSLTGC